MGGLEIDSKPIRIITIIILVILLILYIYKWYKYYKAQKINTWPPNGPAICPDYLSYNPNATGNKCLNPFRIGSGTVSSDGIPLESEEADKASYCNSQYNLTWEGVCDK